MSAEVDVRKRLDEIAKLIKGGQPYQKFEKEMDRLMGIPEELARDEEAEEKWEQEYRKGRE